MAKLPEKGWEGINDPLLREQVKSYQKCCYRTCFDRGRFLPVLLIKIVGQTHEDQTVKFPVPILLCERHKKEASAADILQQKTKDLLSAAVQHHRRAQLNWDTVSFDWREVGPKLPSPKLV